MNEVIYIVRLSDAFGNKMELTTDCYECANGIFENVKWTDEIDKIFFIKDDNGSFVTIKTFGSSVDDDVDLMPLTRKE